MPLAQLQGCITTQGDPAVAHHDAMGASDELLGLTTKRPDSAGITPCSGTTRPSALTTTAAAAARTALTLAPPSDVTVLMGREARSPGSFAQPACGARVATQQDRVSKPSAR
jgi:hypothetical protein